MIAKFFTMMAMAACCYAAYAATPQEQKAARGVIERFTGQKFGKEVELSSMPAQGDCPAYKYLVKGGKLHVKGSNGVALCKGFYDFTTAQGAGIYSWSGKRFNPPTPLPEGVRGKLVSPVPHHYYFNVVTFGYTTAYWDWKRWEKEIDWMALHGIDMPLTLVATEAISARVFTKLGLTDEEIAAWFTGPAHLPWMRMGNISGHDGPLPKEWHADQVKLQHRILKRTRELGMTPVCPGFCGFVPEAITRVFPNAKLTKTHWGGHFNNWMIAPDDPLFTKIGKMFIEEWEKEFGKCSHYIIDSFNEMELPFPPHGKPERYEMLAMYGEKVYKALTAGSPDAVWVMQGWMFGYQRNIWDERSLQALVSRVPDKKMLLLDMAVDYNRHFWHNGNNYEKHKGFYNKGWVYSVIPNMGGKTGLTGMLNFYANGHLHALNYPERGRLIGMGMAPEGIENNEVIYELVANAGWRNSEVKLEDWLAQYNRCRYGSTCPELELYWQNMLKSVYGSFTDHPRYGWQRRPGGGTKGSINANEHLHAAVEAFASCADRYKNNPLYCADLMELTTASIGGRLEELMQAAEEATRQGKKEEAARLDKEIETLMLGIDRLLYTHPTHNLDIWLKFARLHGSTKELKDYYERNARRLVTIWGPPVDDYAAKIWSGLIRDYYLPRWQQYRKHGAGVLPAWEENWVRNGHGTSDCKPFANPVDSARQLLAYAKEAVESAQQPSGPEALAHWSPQNPGADWKDMELNVTSRELKAANGLRFVTEGSAEAGLEVVKISVVMDGKTVLALDNPGKGISFSCKFRIPADAQGNNECKVIIRARNAAGSKGRIELIKPQVTLENLSVKKPFFKTGTPEMTDYAATNRAQSYSFSFKLVGPIKRDTMVAAYWTPNTDNLGAHAFVIDSDTMTLNVGLGEFRTDSDKGEKLTWNQWKWHKDSSKRYDAFSNESGDVALSVGVTYHVKLTKNAEGAQEATLTWDGGSAVATYNGSMNNTGAAGSAVIAEVGAAPKKK